MQTAPNLPVLDVGFDDGMVCNYWLDFQTLEVDNSLFSKLLKSQLNDKACIVLIAKFHL